MVCPADPRTPGRVPRAWGTCACTGSSVCELWVKCNLATPRSSPPHATSVDMLKTVLTFFLYFLCLLGDFLFKRTSEPLIPPPCRSARRQGPHTVLVTVRHRSQGQRHQRPGFKSQLHFLLAPETWESHLTSGSCTDGLLKRLRDIMRWRRAAHT